MKKTIVVFSLIVMGAASVFAGPRGCPGGRGWHRPPCHPGWHRPCPGYYRPSSRGWGRGCSRDLANAAAITSIVANGLNIVGNLTAPYYYSPTPVVVQQPVVVPQQQVIVPQQQVVVPAQPVFAPAVQYYTPAFSTVIYR